MTAAVAGSMQGARADDSQRRRRGRWSLRATRAPSVPGKAVDGIGRRRDRTGFAAPAWWGRVVGVAPIVATLLLVAPSAESALAAPTCEELASDSPRYHAKMDELAERAKLNDSAWNRYHESLVSALCAGKRDLADKLVDQGFVTAAEAERIAAALDKAYTPKRRSETGNRYGAARSRFVEMGACSACADNIAQYYTKKPASRCGTLAQRALGGDAVAIEKLVEFPDWCRWNYGAPAPSAHSSPKG